MMDLGPGSALALAVAMTGIAVVNTALMAWLWRFPMQPDPTGRDPHGVSTAPRPFVNLHRTLGYVFLFCLAVLLGEMIPRLWEFREASAVAVVHGTLGLLVALLLSMKIVIIRRWRRFGHRLPWVGGTLAGTTVLAAGLGVVPAAMLLHSPVPPSVAEGRRAVVDRCLQCHGASTIVAEREDARGWQRIAAEMQREAARTPGKQAISDPERQLATVYLFAVLPEEPRGEVDRRRRGGRDRR